MIFDVNIDPNQRQTIQTNVLHMQKRQERKRWETTKQQLGVPVVIKTDIKYLETIEKYKYLNLLL